MISIITVNYNSGKDLLKTFQSISKIQKSYFELIVIDGCSNDESKDLLKDNKDLIDIMIVEKDKGLYDAMNKGLKLASKKWIIFLNAGDMINEPNFSVIIKRLLSSDSDIIYGNVIGVYNNYKILYKPRNIKFSWRGKPYHHQAAFYRTKALKLYPFNLKYKICADHDQMFRMLNNNKKFEYFDCVISVVEMRFGKSKNKRKEVLEETLQICEENNVNIFKRYILKLRFFKNILIDVIKFLSLMNILRKIKNLKIWN